MNDGERQRIAEVLTILADHYQRPMTPAALAFYVECVDRLPYEAVERALLALGQTEQFWPMPAKVHEFVNGTPADRALRAWMRVEKAMTVAGPYASVDFRDPVIHVTIRHLGGWPIMCEALTLDEHEFGFRRRDFLETYELLARRGHSQEPSRLPGLHEMTNAETRGSWERGLGHVDEVLVIGPHGDLEATRPMLPPAGGPPPLAP